jgi:iron complex transport system ATP-binding protein
MSDAVWQSRGVVYRYAGAPSDAVAQVDCTIAPGELTALIGPNGAGKSTFARLLLGLVPPARGEVLYRGEPAHRWSREAMARQVGFVPQAEEVVFPLRVRDFVAMGRYPHLGPWRAETDADRRVIRESLARVEAEDLEARPFDSLSGGERQRVRIARALAQEGEALLLDEPSAGLDIRHEVELFVLCTQLAAAGRTVVVVTHNLGLAARLAGRVLLFDRGRLAVAGAPRDVLTAATLSRVYGWPVEVVSHPGPGSEAGTPLIVPRIDRASLRHGPTEGHRGAQ